MRSRHLLLLFICLACAARVRASRQDDSLTTEVEGMATNIERAQALLMIAGAQVNSRPDESMKKVLAAIRLAEQAGDQKVLVRAVRQQRDLERSAGAYDQFLISAIRAVSISERLNDAKALADDLDLLCEGYERVGDMDKAIEMRRQALLLLKSTGDSVAISKGIVELMNSLVLAGRFNEVLDQSQEALAYYKAHNDTLGLAMVWLGQGEALLTQHRYADAVPTLSRAERIFRGHNETLQLGRALRDLAEANVGMERWTDARARLDEAIAIWARHPAHHIDPKLLDLESRVYEGLGDLPMALALQRRHATLKDSLFSARVAERILGLQALYNAQRKESENAMLRTQVEVTEDQMVRAEVRGRWWLLACGTLLFILTGLFLMVKRMRRLTRRAMMKNQVVQRQAQEIKTKNMELERQNLRLAESLMSEEQKDVQLKEIHHRVKNNLQIVNSLLEMQGAFLKDKVLQSVLGDCQGRVRSMALVHEHIYRCGDLNRVNVKAHVVALGEAILKHHGLQDRVHLDLNVNYDHAELENLIPLSLLLNELITNSAKHAFTGRTDGRITIVLRRMGENQCELVFSDNGVGMLQEQFFHKESFGLELVRTLASQLDGRIRLLRGEGTTFQMAFEPNLRPLRKAS